MKTEIIAILDRSGSMGSIVNDAIGGFNTFLADQKSVPGEAKLTLVLFDDQYEKPYSAVPISDVPALTAATYTPRGMTALCDAIGKTITTEAPRIDAEKWADQVIVCILTDGEENSSHEYKLPQVKALTEAAQANGWKFVFLAANQDAFQAGASYGFNAGACTLFAATSEGTQKGYATMSGAVRSYRQAPVTPTSDPKETP